MYSAWIREACCLKDPRSNVWTEAEAAENPYELFAAVAAGKPQRVRMPNMADILLTLEQTEEDAKRSLAALQRRPNYLSEDDQE